MVLLHGRIRMGKHLRKLNLYNKTNSADAKSRAADLRRYVFLTDGERYHRKAQ